MPKMATRKGSSRVRMGWTVGQATEVEGGELEEEGGHHETEPGQPDLAAHGVGHEAPPQGRLGRGGLHSHALEDGRQGVGQGRPDGQYIGHMHRFYPMGPGGEQRPTRRYPGPTVTVTQHGHHARYEPPRDRGTRCPRPSPNRTSSGRPWPSWRPTPRPGWRAGRAWGEGSDQVSILPERTLEEEIAELERGPGLGPEAVRRRVQLDHRSRRVRRTGIVPGLPAQLRRPRGRFRHAAHVRLRDRARAWWPRRSWPTPPTR